MSFRLIYRSMPSYIHLTPPFAKNLIKGRLSGSIEKLKISVLKKISMSIAQKSDLLRISRHRVGYDTYPEYTYSSISTRFRVRFRPNLSTKNKKNIKTFNLLTEKKEKVKSTFISNLSTYIWASIERVQKNIKFDLVHTVDSKFR